MARERKSLEQRIAALNSAEQAHLARAEKCRAKKLALIAEVKAKAEAMLATVEQAKEG